MDSFNQVRQTLGQPTTSNFRDTEYGRATTELYLVGNQAITLNYMNGVLTRYEMSAR